MKKIFDKTKLLDLSLKNRIFRGALWEQLADDRGHLTEELTQVYRELAQGGVGTIITGYAFITPDEQPNPKMMGIYDDSFIKEYKEFTKMIHSYGANIIMQIAYGGSFTEYNVGNRVIWGPSNGITETTGTASQEISKDEIKKLVNSYAEAALRVKKSGFDGVEIHAAHGYILSQFLSPIHNRRNDEYGGSIENRGRIIFEIYQAIREKVGEKYPIFIKMNSQDFAEDRGFTENDSIYIGKRLAEMGINAIEISGGDETLKSVMNSDLGPARKKIFLSKDNESYFKNFAAKLADEIDIPIILIGGNRNIDVMENILNSTRIEYFSIARPLTAEPDLINKWSEGNLKSPKCISCNQCYFTEGKRCILNISKK